MGLSKKRQSRFSRRHTRNFHLAFLRIVGRNFVKSVRSKAHILGTDGISFYSAACGRRNSLREGLFDTL